MKACRYIIKRLDKIKKIAENEELKLNKKTTAMKDAVDIKLYKVKIIHLKVIEYVLHEQYYKNDSH